MLIDPEEDKRATTNVQHRFVLFFLLSFLLIELKPFIFEGESPGGKILKFFENVWKMWKFWNDFAL